MPTELPNKITPIDVPSLLSALATAWHAVPALGAPSKASIALLGAQWALETGRGKSMHNFNLGNIKGKPGSTEHDWQFYRCNEIIGGKVVWFDPPNPGCCFRAYETLSEGAADYLALLRGRFASAWPAIVAGDPAAFVHALKLRGYFTANEGSYLAGVARLFHEFLAVDFDLSPAPPEELTAEARERIAAAGLQDLSDLVRGLSAEDQAAAYDPDLGGYDGNGSPVA